MFAKRTTNGARTDADANAVNEEKRAFAAALEERDATIARLERTLAEERAHVATLRESLEQARFRAEILEKSYSTQLTEARNRAGAAEQAVTGAQARATELEGACEEQAKLLADSRDALERTTADRDRLLVLLEPAGGPETVARERGSSRVSQAQSIDEMLASLEVPRDRPLGAGHGSLPSDAEAAQPMPLEEMLPPELLLAGKAKT